MTNCPECARLEGQIAGLKLSLKRLREQYDRAYTGASMAWKYKRERDDLRATLEAIESRPAESNEK